MALCSPSLGTQSKAPDDTSLQGDHSHQYKKQSGARPWCGAGTRGYRAAFSMHGAGVGTLRYPAGRLGGAAGVVCSTVTCWALREGSRRHSCTASAHVTLSLLLASCLWLGSMGKAVNFDSGFRQHHMLCSHVGWHRVQLWGHGDHGARYGNIFSSLGKQGCCFQGKVDVVTLSTHKRSSHNYHALGDYHTSCTQRFCLVHLWFCKLCEKAGGRIVSHIVLGQSRLVASSSSFWCIWEKLIEK